MEEIRLIGPRLREARQRKGPTITPVSPEDAQIQVYRITYPPSDGAPEVQVHPGREWMYVLSGVLRLYLGSDVYEVGPGESVEFDTEIPHAFRSGHGLPTTILCMLGEAGQRPYT